MPVALPLCFARRTVRKAAAPLFPPPPPLRRVSPAAALLHYFQGPREGKKLKPRDKRDDSAACFICTLITVEKFPSHEIGGVVGRPISTWRPLMAFCCFSPPAVVTTAASPCPGDVSRGAQLYVINLHNARTWALEALPFRRNGNEKCSFRGRNLSAIANERAFNCEYFCRPLWMFVFAFERAKRIQVVLGQGKEIFLPLHPRLHRIKLHQLRQECSFKGDLLHKILVFSNLTRN